MTDEVKNEPPQPVREIVTAIVARALARCDREGIAWEDFYRAMTEEQALSPKAGLVKVLERTFLRLSRSAN